MPTHMDDESAPRGGVKAPVVPDLCSVAGHVKSMVTEVEVLAFLKKVIELFVSERNALKGAGLDVELMLTTLKSLLEQAATMEQHQETMKRQSKLATESWLVVKRNAYVTTSGYLDMAIAAVRKDSSTAANFRRIRSRMHRPSAEEGEKPIVTPVKS